MVVLAQVVTLLEPDLRGWVFDLGGGKWVGESGVGVVAERPVVGHSAHLGGFLFGAVVMWAFEWGVGKEDDEDEDS